MSKEEINAIQKELSKLKDSFDVLHVSLAEHIIKADAIFEDFRSQEASFRRHTINSQKTAEMHEEIKRLFKEHEEKMQPMYETFTHLDWSKTALLWLFGAIATIVGAMLAVKEFFK